MAQLPLYMVTSLFLGVVFLCCRSLSRTSPSPHVRIAHNATSNNKKKTLIHLVTN